VLAVAGTTMRGWVQVTSDDDTKYEIGLIHMCRTPGGAEENLCCVGASSPLSIHCIVLCAMRACAVRQRGGVGAGRRAVVFVAGDALNGRECDACAAPRPCRCAAREISFCRFFGGLEGKASPDLECEEYRNIQGGRTFTILHVILAGLALLGLPCAGSGDCFKSWKTWTCIILALAGACAVQWCRRRVLSLVSSGDFGAVSCRGRPSAPARCLPPRRGFRIHLR
jgi:hypothetical protein